ncbi:hypothetical protein DASB73_001120 [Starmerella bacillaris]|uniref:Uncharacterized protein n=1 Tax=Starmerella bacillaris TaxID=1247836 RepID=A0AAV5RCF1_STABA|nr:hypothetical protein DASB73_001120 [Starmerella bacillaris]
MSRLDVSVSQCRELFRTLLEDGKSVFNSVTHSQDGSAALSEADQEETWSVVERELRQVWEMARFGLNVFDLDDMHDIDKFRGFCEDNDGIDPVDEQLLNRLTTYVSEIYDGMSDVSNNRVLIPQGLEDGYEEYVTNRRAYYSELLADLTSTDTANVDAIEQTDVMDVDNTPTEIDPQELLRLVAETKKRMEHSMRLLENLKSLE